MYTVEDYEPLITKHDVTSEAKYLASFLNQDTWVIERLLRDYWKDKIGIQWTIDDVKKCCPPNIILTDKEAFDILQNVSIDYSPTWGITGDDVEHSIEIYIDDKDKEKENCCGHCK